MLSRWWQLKYFWNFHPENWGNDPIRRAYFSEGLKPPTSYFFTVLFPVSLCGRRSKERSFVRGLDFHRT